MQDRMAITTGALVLIVTVAMGCAAGIWALKGVIEHDINANNLAAIHRDRVVLYTKTVADYRACTVSQKNTQQGNVRGNVLKKFIDSARIGRIRSAKVSPPDQAKIDLVLAKQYEDQKKRLHPTPYIYCDYPRPGPGVAAVKHLPVAPYNKEAVRG